MDKLVTALEKWFSIAGTLMVAIMALIVTLEVVFRYLKVEVSGIYETSEALIVFVIYLGLSHTQNLRRHISVDLISSHLTPSWKRVLNVFGLVLSLVFMAFLTWRTGDNAIRSTVMREATMGIIAFPVWPGRIVIPIGSALMCLRLVLQLIVDFKGGHIQKAPDEQIDSG